MKFSSPRQIRSLTLALALALSGALVGCSGPQHTPDEEQNAAPGPLKDGESSGDEDGLVALRIIGFNDFHGNLEGPAGQVEDGAKKVDAGGVAYFKSYIDKLREGQSNSIVVGAGDLIGASPLISAVFHDEPTIEAMNLLGLELSSVGNHEFDQGHEELQRKQSGGCHPDDECDPDKTFQGADFKYLAANVVDETGEPIFPAYEIKTFEDIPVAFIGLVLSGTPDIVSPNALKGLTFLDEVEVINELSDELQAQGVEAIVVLIHEGAKPTVEMESLSDCGDAQGPVVDIVKNSSDAVDVFITGHTHQNYICTIDDKLVTSARSYGRVLTEINLKLDPTSGDIVEQGALNHAVLNDDLPEDEELKALVDNYREASAEIANRPLGTITEEISRSPNEAGESALGDIVADAQLAATSAEENGGAQVAFMNPGGIRADLDFRDETEEGVGTVTYADLHRILPFGNTVVTMSMTGAQLKQLLEQQWDGDYPVMLQISEGFSYTFDPDGEPGSLVDPESIKLNGEVLKPEQTYRVATNDFLAEGGDGMTLFKEGTEREMGQTALDILADYFAENSPLSPGPQDRILTKE